MSLLMQGLDIVILLTDKKLEPAVIEHSEYIRGGVIPTSPE